MAARYFVITALFVLSISNNAKAFEMSFSHKDVILHQFTCNDLLKNSDEYFYLLGGGTDWAYNERTSIKTQIEHNYLFSDDKQCNEKIQERIKNAQSQRDSK